MSCKKSALDDVGHCRWPIAFERPSQHESSARHVHDHQVQQAQLLLSAASAHGLRFAHGHQRGTAIDLRRPWLQLCVVRRQAVQADPCRLKGPRRPVVLIHVVPTVVMIYATVLLQHGLDRVVLSEPHVDCGSSRADGRAAHRAAWAHDVARGPTERGP